MPTIEEQLALRARLQSVETDLLAKGQRHVQLIGAAGTFEWVKAGALHEPIQQAQGDIQEAEDMIVAQGLRNVMVATDEGLFLWHAKPTKPKASKRPKGGRPTHK